MERQDAPKTDDNRSGVADTQGVSPERGKSNDNRPHHHHKDKRHSRHHHHSRRSHSKSSSESRSRSGSKSASRSRSRSRHGHKKHSGHRSKDEKRYRFDSPPKELTTGGTAAALQNIQAAALAQASRADRKLYIGNLPPGTTPPALVEQLNKALVDLKATVHEGGPIISAWVSADGITNKSKSKGHYAFVEFRSAEEANKAYILNTVLVDGQQLKVGRPKAYANAAPHGVQGLTVGSVMQQPMGATVVPSAPTTQPAAIPVAPSVPEPTVPIEPRLLIPSRVITLKNLVDPQDLVQEQDFADVLQDITEECGKLGKLLSVEIVRPTGGAQDKRPEVGRVFLEYASIDDAKEAKKQLGARKYAGKLIETGFYPEHLYHQKDFSLCS